MKGRLAAALAVLALAAPLPVRAEGGPRLHQVTVYAHDTGFEAPTRVPSGPTTLHFVNHGWEPHRMLLLRLADTLDLAALRAALPLGEQPVAGITSLGGTGLERAEGSEDLSVALGPGRYALVCDAHKGPAEIHEFHVVAYDEPTLPPADWSVLLGDDGVRAPAALTAGARWLRVENHGTRLHGLGLGRLLPGRSEPDARAWLRAPSGPQPWVRSGGTAPLSPGEAVLLDVAMIPGDYVLFAPGRDGGARPDGYIQPLAVREQR